MKVAYAVPGTPSLASFRLRVFYPGFAIKERGYECSIQIPPRGDINVFMKHYEDNAMVMADAPGVTVFDVCNDHFASERYGELYHTCCKIAGYITCNSEPMAARVKQETGRDATIIPDPYEQAKMYPQFDVGASLPRLVWFGHRSNLEQVERIPVPQVDDMYSHIEVVTGLNGASRTANPYITYTQWSIPNVALAVRRADLVVLPGDEDKCRSANRAIDAIRLGKFVVAEPMPSYEELGEFIWMGDLMEGIKWACRHPKEVLEKLEAGQEYVDSRFSPDAVGERWADLFDSILGVETKSSPAGSTLIRSAEEARART